MPYTFGDLKTELRGMIFPDGEASNLVTAHNKSFVDAVMDIQKWVACKQQDNLSTYPQCATYYRCGLTILPAPRGSILKVSVIDQNAETHENDWCSEIEYRQIEFEAINNYLNYSKSGTCLPLHLFFCIDYDACRKTYPTPTGEGLPAGLPALPIGYNYAEASTDSEHGRAYAGVWAMDRGRIYIAPWIQSTETVLVKWDGLKRTWNDNDPCDDDPLYTRAVRAWVSADHARDFDRDYEAEAGYRKEYAVALSDLIHECREESRNHAEAGGASAARSSLGSAGKLYQNTAQSATAYCPAGTTGNPEPVTIAAGTVSSTRSVAHANELARAEALRQATAKLDCDTVVVRFQNTRQEATVCCADQSDDLHPPVDGGCITEVVEANTAACEAATQTEADACAKDLATANATAALRTNKVCTWWNREVIVVKKCTNNEALTAEGKVLAHEIFSQSGQDDADTKAKIEAENRANVKLLEVCDDLFVYESPEFNDPKTYTFPYANCPSGVNPILTITIHMDAGAFKRTDLQGGYEAAYKAAKDYVDLQHVIWFNYYKGHVLASCQSESHTEDVTPTHL